MGKITKVALNSANIKYSNGGDESRVYEITADCEITRKNKLGSYSSGEVKKVAGEEATTVATFNGYYGSNQSVHTSQGVDTSDKCSIMEAIDGFLNEVDAVAESGTAI